MEIQIFDSYHKLSEKLAERIILLIQKKPAAVVCLAAGDTPRLAYELIAKIALAKKIDFSRCTFIALDEWVGIPPENEGSCHFFLKKNLFEPLSIDTSQIHLFDALATDLEQECRKMNAAISNVGGIDCIVVGIGMNGHIGFNEPGVAWDLSSHVTDLDDNTRSVGQKYFSQKTRLDKGITLGLQQLLDAREAILIANGKKKAEIVQSAFESPPQTSVPASIMQVHPNGYIMIDREAASLLSITSGTSRLKR